MTTFRDFDAEIRAIEGRLAYGSETSIYGYFVDQMSKLGGPKWRESDTAVPDGEAAWWRKAYELYAADMGKPEADRAATVQELFDAVSV